MSAETVDPVDDPAHEPTAPVMPLTHGDGLLASLDPDTLQRQLADGFNAALAQMRKEAGPVLAEQDVHPRVRAVHAVLDRAGQFAHAFNALRKNAAEALEEELLEGVGEQDGVPNKGMTVPMPDGTKLRLTPEFKNVRVFDIEPALTGVVALVDDEWEAAGRKPGDDYAGFALEVARRAIDGLLAKSELKITGVRELQRELGARELDKVAGTVGKAVVSETRRYEERVEVEVQRPKSKA